MIDKIIELLTTVRGDFSIFKAISRMDATASGGPWSLQAVAEFLADGLVPYAREHLAAPEPPDPERVVRPVEPMVSNPPIVHHRRTHEQVVADKQDVVDEAESMKMSNAQRKVHKHSEN